jgi:hypothetical protein
MTSECGSYITLGLRLRGLRLQFYSRPGRLNFTIRTYRINVSISSEGRTFTHLSPASHRTGKYSLKLQTGFATPQETYITTRSAREL